VGRKIFQDLIVAAKLLECMLMTMPASRIDALRVHKLNMCRANFLFGNLVAMRNMFAFVLIDAVCLEFCFLRLEKF